MPCIRPCLLVLHPGLAAHYCWYHPYIKMIILKDIWSRFNEILHSSLLGTNALICNDPAMIYNGAVSIYNCPALIYSDPALGRCHSFFCLQYSHLHHWWLNQTAIGEWKCTYIVVKMDGLFFKDSKIRTQLYLTSHWGSSCSNRRVCPPLLRLVTTCHWQGNWLVAVA